MQTEQIFKHVESLGAKMATAMTQVADHTGCLANIRQFGAMVAADLTLPSNNRPGFQVYQQALKHGALMRPLGNTLYWLPPLNTPLALIDQLAEVTEKSITAVL